MPTPAPRQRRPSEAPARRRVSLVQLETLAEDAAGNLLKRASRSPRIVKTPPAPPEPPAVRTSPGQRRLPTIVPERPPTPAAPSPGEPSPRASVPAGLRELLAPKLPPLATGELATAQTVLAEASTPRGEVRVRPGTGKGKPVQPRPGAVQPVFRSAEGETTAGATQLFPPFRTKEEIESELAERNVEPLFSRGEVQDPSARKVDNVKIFKELGFKPGEAGLLFSELSPAVAQAFANGEITAQQLRELRDVLRYAVQRAKNAKEIMQLRMKYVNELRALSPDSGKLTGKPPNIARFISALSEALTQRVAPGIKLPPVPPVIVGKKVKMRVAGGGAPTRDELLAAAVQPAEAQTTQAIQPPLSREKLKVRDLFASAGISPEDAGRMFPTPEVGRPIAAAIKSGEINPETLLQLKNLVIEMAKGKETLAKYHAGMEKAHPWVETGNAQGALQALLSHAQEILRPPRRPTPPVPVVITPPAPLSAPATPRRPPPLPLDALKAAGFVSLPRPAPAPGMPRPPIVIAPGTARPPLPPEPTVRGPPPLPAAARVVMPVAPIVNVSEASKFLFDEHGLDDTLRLQLFGHAASYPFVATALRDREIDKGQLDRLRAAQTQWDQAVPLNEVRNSSRRFIDFSKLILPLFQAGRPREAIEQLIDWFSRDRPQSPAPSAPAFTPRTPVPPVKVEPGGFNAMAREIQAGEPEVIPVSPRASAVHFSKARDYLQGRGLDSRTLHAAGRHSAFIVQLADAIRLNEVPEHLVLNLQRKAAEYFAAAPQERRAELIRQRSELVKARIIPLLAQRHGITALNQLTDWFTKNTPILLGSPRQPTPLPPAVPFGPREPTAAELLAAMINIKEQPEPTFEIDAELPPGVVKGEIGPKPRQRPRVPTQEVEITLPPEQVPPRASTPKPAPRSPTPQPAVAPPGYTIDPKYMPLVGIGMVPDNIVTLFPHRGSAERVAQALASRAIAPATLLELERVVASGLRGRTTEDRDALLAAYHAHEVLARSLLVRNMPGEAVASLLVKAREIFAPLAPQRLTTPKPAGVPPAFDPGEKLPLKSRSATPAPASGGKTPSPVVDEAAAEWFKEGDIASDALDKVRRGERHEESVVKDIRRIPGFRAEVEAQEQAPKESPPVPFDSAVRSFSGSRRVTGLRWLLSGRPRGAFELIKGEHGDVAPSHAVITIDKKRILVKTNGQTGFSLGSSTKPIKLITRGVAELPSKELTTSAGSLVEVQHGNYIQIGANTFEIRRVGDKLELTGVAGPVEGREFRVGKKTVTIGSDPKLSHIALIQAAVAAAKKGR